MNRIATWLALLLICVAPFVLVGAHILAASVWP